MILELLIELLLDPELWGTVLEALIGRQDWDNQELLRWNRTGL